MLPQSFVDKIAYQPSLSHTILKTSIWRVSVYFSVSETMMLRRQIQIDFSGDSVIHGGFLFREKNERICTKQFNSVKWLKFQMFYNININNFSVWSNVHNFWFCLAESFLSKLLFFLHKTKSSLSKIDYISLSVK